MAKISIHGTEIARCLVNGRLVSVRSDGTVLHMDVHDRKWRIRGTKKPSLTLAEWTEKKKEWAESLPFWARNVKSLPSHRRLAEWASDSVCETVTGDTVEPDGTGPDGAPSWLVALGMI